MSPLLRQRIGAIVGLLGVSAAVGALVLLGRRQAKTVAGRLGFLQPKYRFVDQRYSPAPMIERTSSGGMKIEHRRSAEMPIEERVASVQDLVWKSIQDPQMRKLALQITRHCPERDGVCETKAVYDYIKKNVRYTGDVAPVKMGRNGPIEGVDLFQSAKRTLEFGGGDCLPQGTLLLTESMKLAPIEDLIIGQKIWGRDAWTTVKDVWFKGVLPVDVVFMNNGSSFKATADHKVYVALCNSHPVTWANGGSCSCPMSERSVERIKLAQLEPGMVLVQPDQIAFGTEDMDPDKAYIEGLFLSDGDCDRDSAFRIAGQDGCPKEDQKREVAQICERLGVGTHWNRKYITVKDGDWAKRVQQMGLRAWNKHALSINLSQEAAGELLRGIMADSGANTNGNGRTFTTTSRELMLQTRILHRMFGRSCSERYIVDHGGLGEHPIWRLGVRDNARSDGKAVKLLRVKAIERDVVELPVYDISTADHYVYLPEADVTVSNCDDHSVLASTLLALNGITPRLRVTASSRNGEDEHIYAVAGLPKTAPRKWVAVDTTLPGDDQFGVEHPAGRITDFPA